MRTEARRRGVAGRIRFWAGVGLGTFIYLVEFPGWLEAG